MNWWQAMILGIVEGLTEYLPVSSTGHLLVVQAMLGIGVESEAAKEAADAYAICIQAGAIVAVLGLYFKRVKQMTLGLVGQDVAGRRLLINLVTAFMPAAVIGLLLNKLIKQHLFGVWPVVIAWLVGGVAILLVSRMRRGKGGAAISGETAGGRGVDQITWRIALVIGLAQCIAMWPGTSRSLVTIVGGLLMGLTIASAVEFSFLLGVMTLGAATCYDGLKHGQHMIEAYGPSSLAIGFVFAFISAVIAIKWMVAYLQRHTLEIFGWYRIAVALIVAALVVTEVLSVA